MKNQNEDSLPPYCPPPPPYGLTFVHDLVACIVSSALLHEYYRILPNIIKTPPIHFYFQVFLRTKRPIPWR